MGDAGQFSLAGGLGEFFPAARVEALKWL